MDRTTILWTLTLFFGASVVFGLIRTATEDKGVATSAGLQAIALVVILGVILVAVRR
jgi:hypothetical protein